MNRRAVWDIVSEEKIQEWADVLAENRAIEDREGELTIRDQRRADDAAESYAMWEKVNPMPRRNYHDAPDA